MCSVFTEDWTDFLNRTFQLVFLCRYGMSMFNMNANITKKQTESEVQEPELDKEKGHGVIRYTIAYDYILNPLVTDRNVTVCNNRIIMFASDTKICIATTAGRQKADLQYQSIS